MLRKTEYIKEIYFDKLKADTRNIRSDGVWEEYNNPYNFIQEYRKILGVKLPEQIHHSCGIISPNASCWSDDTQEERQRKHQQESLKNIEKVQKGVNHYLKLNQKIDVLFKDDTYTLFRYTQYEYTLIPNVYIMYEQAPDYDQLTYNDVVKKLDGPASNALVIKTEGNYKEVSGNLDKVKKDLEIAKEQAEKEMNEFKQMMYQQEKALKEKQEAMLSELERVKNDLEDKIFVLEMNIFALRSFFGETYCMMEARKGELAPDAQPLVIYQKFRYLDEEFARLEGMGIFNRNQYELVNVFEKSDALLETFCPNTKCITFFKVTKKPVGFTYSREGDCLEEFEIYHGNQIGMVIRNGESVSVAFIDEEVTLQDNLFVTEGSAHQEVAVTQDSRIRDKEVRPMFSRRLIFIILQQLVNNTNIFKGLKGEDIFNSPNIILSNADKQIVSYSYPSFSQYFKEYKSVIIGDDVFVTTNHAGSKSTNNVWGGGWHEEHRSVGYANRGRDANIKEGIATINLIQKEPYGWFKKVIQDGREVITNAESNEEGAFQRFETNYFVSCKREVYDYQRTRRWDGSFADVNNVNLKIYEDEYMSVMWLNSNYIREWIDAKHIGDWHEGNYTYIVPKLKDLKDYLEKREEEESRMFTALLPEFAYTAAKKDEVLDWRIKNKVRRLTPFQAKRFLKASKYLV